MCIGSKPLGPQNWFSLCWTQPGLVESLSICFVAVCLARSIVCLWKHRVAS